MIAWYWLIAAYVIGAITGAAVLLLAQFIVSAIQLYALFYWD